jgi:DNA polymerase-1
MVEDIERLSTTLKEISGRSFLNPNSWMQLAECLWDDMKLVPNPNCKSNMDRRKKGKTDNRSTAEDALDHLASVNSKSGRKVRDGVPFIDALVEYRRVAKLKSSYVDNLIEAAERSTDGRIHATANVHGTEVGRLSFNDPALQTIPRESDLYGRVIRSAFMAGPGNMLAILDYSQAEFRVFAAESKDPALLQAYRDGRDIHDEVARGLYGDGFTKEQRVMAKMWDFAWIYGGTEHSFAQDAGMPLDQASAWVGRFNERFPVAVAWKRDKFLEAKSRGYVSTRTGRRRRFPLITRENLEEVRKGSVHSIVAGGASDCTLLSLVEAERRGIHCVLTVHDSIIIEEPEDLIEARTQELLEIMVATAAHYYPEVPWKVDVEIRRTWVERPPS